MRQFHFFFRTADAPRQGAAVVADEFQRIHAALIQREIVHAVHEHQHQNQNRKHRAGRDQNKLPFQSFRHCPLTFRGSGVPLPEHIATAEFPFN